MQTREELEARAAELGIKVQPNMKDETIQKRIEEAEAKTKAEAEAKAKAEAEEKAKAEAKAKAAQSEPAGGHVIVTGPVKGRWRIGKFFTREQTRLELAELSDDQLAALNADPTLAVLVVEAG